MIIVSGRIYVAEGQVDTFVAASREAVEQARHTEGCLDFIVAADPLEAQRVNVYEEWASEEALLAFRGDGPSEDLTSVIQDAKVMRHQISSSGPT